MLYSTVCCHVEFMHANPCSKLFPSSKVTCHCILQGIFCDAMKTFTAGALVAAASATDLSLTWSDCGDASTKTKISAFKPSSLTLGQKTTMTGTGALSEDVPGATFDLEMTGAIGKLVSRQGDASAAKTCSLPLGTGSLTFDAMTFPLKAGSTDVNVDISLSSAVPASLQTTTTRCTAAASNGDKLFCIEIKSAPAQAVHPERAAQIEEIQKTSGVMWKAAAHPRFASQAPGAFKDMNGLSDVLCLSLARLFCN